MHLNASIPHFYCYLRAEYLYDLQSHHGELIPCAVFGVASIPSRALMFHAMTENGAQIARLPIAAFCWKKEAPSQPLEMLELWDCFSYDVAVTQFEYLKGLRVDVLLRDRHRHTGEYMMTIDWCGSSYSEDAGEGGHKNAHLIKLENGNFALQPNNRCFWFEPSFITAPLTGNPGYKTNSHTWSVENKGGKWMTSHDDRMFYDTKAIESNPALERIGKRVRQAQRVTKKRRRS